MKSETHNNTVRYSNIVWEQNLIGSASFPLECNKHKHVIVQECDFGNALHPLLYSLLSQVTHREIQCSVSLNNPEIQIQHFHTVKLIVMQRRSQMRLNTATSHAHTVKQWENPLCPTADVCWTKSLDPMTSQDMLISRDPLVASLCGFENESYQK